MSGQPALPLVSVIVAMRNEEGFIEKCLDSLGQQDYPQELLEILVIDGRSTDSSREVVGAKQRSMPHLSLLDNERRVSPVAFNIGIRQARGEILTIISAHSYLAPDYVSRCVEYLTKTDADCVGGPIETVGETDTARAIALAMSSPFGVGDALFRYSQQETYVDSLAFGAYRREVFQRVGLFDEELVGSEDDEFNYRLRSQGGKLLLTPAIRSFYHGRSSFGALCRQYFRYGLGKMRVLAKHPRLVRLRHLIPALFVLALALLALLSLVHPFFALLLAIVVGSYLIVSLLVSFRIASRHGWRFLLLLPLAFACLHLAYGTGFLLGIPRFVAYRFRGAQS
ncbi:MAG TPA: glycosyltransferase family 2 protein [Anaerolineae bacterium]|nr:glycosyltransferase family 2 protein [Anaerolineae bacterium]